MSITKVVIPAAGLGTRFLPYTKTIPKEMIAIGDRPAIQRVIEEGVAAGISDFFIIANTDKKLIFDYFAPAPEIEKKLDIKNKLSLLESVSSIQQKTIITQIEQPEPLGLGHAILQAKNAIGKTFFGVMLPDDIMVCDIPAIAQLIAISKKYNASVIAVCTVPKEKSSSYGIISIKKELEPGIFQLADLVEKPLEQDAPSNLGIIGRYLLSPRIFEALEKTIPGSGGEIQLTDGIKKMMHDFGETVIAVNVAGTRHDVGNPAGWKAAINALVS